MRKKEIKEVQSLSLKPDVQTIKRYPRHFNKNCIKCIPNPNKEDIY